MSAAPTTTPQAHGRRIDAWLRPARVRAHAALLALCLWGMLAAGSSAPGLRDRSGVLKGADFLQFYVAGSLAGAGRGAELYDYDAHVAEALRRVPASRGTTFLPIYGPQVALLFAPFARLSYAAALAAWVCLSALLYALCVFAVWRGCPRLAGHGRSVALVALAYPPFFSLVGHGQSSALALACTTGSWLGIRAGRPFAAGLALGLLAYKPQLALGAGLVLLAAGEWRILAGACTTAIAELALPTAVLGLEPLQSYAAVVLRFGELAPTLGFKLHQMHSLRAFFELLAPRPAATLAWGLAAVGALGLALRTWRSALPLGVRFAVLLVASALVNPHQYMYDLVFLAPAGLLLVDASLTRPEGPWTAPLRVLLYAAFVSPALGPLARFTHVQLSVLALAGILLLAAREAGRSETGRPAPQVSPRGEWTPSPVSS